MTDDRGATTAGGDGELFALGSVRLASRDQELTMDVSQQQNIAAYLQQLPRLLEEHPGRFVVFASGRLCELFDTYDAALTYGYSTFGRGTFLVQAIKELPRQGAPTAFPLFSCPA